MGKLKAQHEGAIQVNGAKVKRLREAKGWSRDALCKEIARLRKESPSQIETVESGTINRLETGNAAFPRTVFAIATALGVSVDDLRMEDPLHRFAAFIEERTQGFVGREFVFAGIDAFQAGHRSGYFIIEGDPGVGKSALLAEFVRRARDIQHLKCVHHFNSHALGVTSAAQFLDSVCAQLINECALPYSEVPADCLEDGQFLASLLKRASEKLGKGERLVIAVDALDEVDPPAGANSSNPLFLPPVLPEGVFFVLTSRRQSQRALSVQAGTKTFDLNKHEAENRDDIAAYVGRCMADGDLAEYMAKQKIGANDLLEALVTKSELNFMYLVHVIPLLQEGEAYHDRSLEMLPAGLQGYYDDHWRRMGMTASPLPRDKLNVIFVLSIVKRPTPRRMIADSLKTDAVTVQTVLDEWTAFLHVHLSEAERCYSLYHSSFRDFLHRKDIVQAAGLELKGVKARYAKYLLELLRSP